MHHAPRQQSPSVGCTPGRGGVELGRPKLGRQCQNRACSAVRDRLQPSKRGGRGQSDEYQGSRHPGKKEAGVLQCRPGKT